MLSSFIKRNSLGSLTFLFSLILLNGIGVTLPVPNLNSIGEHYNFPFIGIIEALFIVFSTIALMIWGYLVDKLNRKYLLLAANIIWLIPACMIFLIPSYFFIYIIIYIDMVKVMSTLISSKMPDRPAIQRGTQSFKQAI